MNMEYSSMNVECSSMNAECIIYQHLIPKHMRKSKIRPPELIKDKKPRKYLFFRDTLYFFMTNETSSPTLFLSKLGVEEGQRTVAFTESCRPGLRRPLELTAAHRNPMPSAAAPKSFLRNHLRTLVCSWICQEKKWWISLFQGICIFELVRCSFWVDDVKVGGWVLYLVAAGR